MERERADGASGEPEEGAEEAAAAPEDEETVEGEFKEV